MFHVSFNRNFELGFPGLHYMVCVLPWFFFGGGGRRQRRQRKHLRNYVLIDGRCRLFFWLCCSNVSNPVVTKNRNLCQTGKSRVHQGPESLPALAMCWSGVDGTRCSSLQCFMLVLTGTFDQDSRNFSHEIFVPDCVLFLRGAGRHAIKETAMFDGQRMKNCHNLNQYFTAFVDVLCDTAFVDGWATRRRDPRTTRREKGG